MKKLNIALVFLMICLTSCIHMLDKAAEAVSESAEQSQESVSQHNFNTVAVDSMYRLDVPKYMKKLENLHPEASLQYANIYKEAYTVVIHESKDEFVEIFTELDEYNSELSPVENYVIVQKKMFEETISSLRIQDYGLIEINNLPARQIKVFGVIDNINFAYLVAFIEGDDNIYMIMNWTTDDRFKRFENTFEYINGTFKLL